MIVVGGWLVSYCGGGGGEGIRGGYVRSWLWLLLEWSGVEWD